MAEPLSPKARLRRQVARALWRHDGVELPVADRNGHWKANRADYLTRADKLMKAMTAEKIGAELVAGAAVDSGDD